MQQNGFFTDHDMCRREDIKKNKVSDKVKLASVLRYLGGGGDSTGIEKLFGFAAGTFTSNILGNVLDHIISSLKVYGKRNICEECDDLA